MKLKYSACLAAAMMTSVPVTATAGSHDRDALGLLAAGFEYLGRSFVQIAVMAVRSEVEMVYGDVIVDARSGMIAITDVRAWPESPFSFDALCEVNVGRLELSGDSSGDLGKARIDLYDLEVAPGCLPEEPQGMMGALGYETLGADVVSIHYDYDIGSAALNLQLAAALTDIAEVQAAVELDYFSVSPETIEGGPDAPIADLAFAEIVISDSGGLERARPMLESMIGDLAAAPAMAEGGVLSVFAEGGQPVTPEQTAFAADLRGAAEGLIAGTGDIVITVEPAEPVRLDPFAFASPGDAFALLNPSASSRVAARRDLIGPDLLASALSGGSLSDEDRMAVGKALSTGYGAPLAPELGEQVLTPLIEAWNGEAAMIAAEAKIAAGGAELDAYGYAVAAGAGGADGAGGLAEMLEGRLPVREILAVQSEAGAQWPGSGDANARMMAAIEAGDVAALRSMASAAANGDGMPRDHVAAYALATLGAAAGDRSAGALRDRIARRYTARGGADAAAWAAAAAEAEALVMSFWLDGGLAGKLAE